MEIQIHPTTSTRDEEEQEQEKPTNVNQSSSRNQMNRSTTTHLPQQPIATMNSFTSSRKLPTTIILLLFYFHLLTTTILIIFLTIRGLVFTPVHHGHHRGTFYPLHFYLPLLTSSACAGVIAFSFQASTHLNPRKTLKAALWLSPLLTFGAGILLLVIGTSTSFVVAALALVFALVQSLYACWIVPRLEHTKQMLSASLSAPVPAETTKFVSISIIAGTTYSCVSISGIGGATFSSTRFDPLFICLILLSMGWTMHVLKNVLHIAFSRVGYMYFAHEIEVQTSVAIKDTLKHCLGSVCVGSILVPVLGVFRGLARALNAVGGETDEFMFSCTSCFAGVAGKLVAYGNRWGLVHVGVYGKGFVNASMDTWEMFKRAGMESLIDTDLTGSFCFFCGVAGGSLCTLVGGSWALAVDADKSLATGVSIYAFLVGYFMVRIGMAAPQASVSAYHVAFAENPGSSRLDSTIPNRIKALQRLSEA